MSAYSYIRIALRGEYQGATRTLYSYPSVVDDGRPDPEWDTSMVEPEAAIKRFLNATDCYVLQSEPFGHYISLITRDVTRPERGYLMISILVDNGCALTGRQVYNLFKELKRTLIEEDRFSDQEVDAAIRAAGIPEQPVCLDSWRYNEERPEPTAEAAYRTYMSTQELESIFAFPAQPDYEQYRCILVVSATISLRPGVKMPRITVPVRKQYNVVCPEGVSASAEQVYDGERLKLTYSKPGFNTHFETITVGEPSAPAKYDGNTIIVRPAHHAGVRFVRRITARVVSTKGQPLNGYTISVNGRSVNTLNPYIELSETDLAEGAEVEIIAASTNYHSLKLVKPASELLTMTELELPLKPVEHGVTLRLDFGDTRVFEVEILIEKNTQEYNRLHSGNFHGFRAHRQVTDSRTEVYNIDLRHSTPPVAPNFESARAESARAEATVNGETTPSQPAQPANSQRRAPRFDNISSEAGERKPVIDYTRPSKEGSRPSKEAEAAARRDAGKQYDFDTDPTDDPSDDVEAHVPLLRRKKVRIGLAVVAAVALIFALIAMLGGSGSNGSNMEMRHTEVGADSTANGENYTPVPPATPEEQADIDYLNANSTWDLSKLKSPMGTQLAQALTAGDIKAIVNNDYFAVRGRCTNTKANEIVDMIWRAFGSPTERSNVRKLRLSVKDNTVELRKMSDAVAKARPADGENTAARPQK